MARKTKSKPSKRALEDDDILESDSEIDEFENYKAAASHPGASDSGDEDEDAEGFDDGFGSEEEEEGAGVGMYEPDEWDGGDSSSDDSDEDDEAAQMKKLKKGLDSIPLETLRKAQRGLKKSSSAAEDSDDESGMTARERKLAEAKARLADMARAKGKGKHIPEDDGYPPGFSREEREREKEREEIKKRENKHAPTVMSTKKQVSRRRTVISQPTIERRDPRFSSISAGKADADLHARGYSFLPEMQKEEVANLRSAVAAAMKAEKTCKLVEKPRFTAERERLEKELSRARSRYERTVREAREREVLAKAKREEREKQKEGKGAWFMKKSEKRDLLLKARFESLEAQGGKRAVKKAMDKKMKKVAGKEKKSRPFAAGGGAGMEGDRKRRRVA